MKDMSEYIDDYCYARYGHFNWGYLSTYSKEELAKAKHDIDGSIVFWHEDNEESEEE